MTQNNATLLFIPDISGFTEFVNSTEIKHSKHIISELLELIINSDLLNLKVSEIEGDAILWYKDSVPSTKELVQQCEVIFKKFHSHLKRYDTERICRCGACESASNLSLKFIVHAGEVDKINIKDHEKLHGADVILAHRLMKNAIKSSEYVLFSQNIDFDLEDMHQVNWINVKSGSNIYDSIGEVKYSYIPLENLHQGIPPAKAISFPELGAEKIVLSKKINAPVSKVYENFTDFDKRLQWNHEIKDIIMHDNKLNQTGAIHTCLVGNNTLDIEALGRLENHKSIVYGERLNKFKALRDVINIFTFEKGENHTTVRIEIGFKVKSIFSALIRPLVRKKLYNQTLDSLQKLKEACE